MSTASRRIPQAPILGAKPANPEAGQVRFYGRGTSFYALLPGGDEIDLGGGGGGGNPNPPTYVQTTQDPSWPAGTVWFDPDDNTVPVSEIIEVYPFFQTGPLTVTAGAARVYLEENYAVESIRASVGTAPVGASVIADVNLNGTTVFTTQANRPTIVAGAFTDLAEAADGWPTGTTVGMYLTVDIDQIGSTTAGSDLNVVIRLRRR